MKIDLWLLLVKSQDRTSSRIKYSLNSQLNFSLDTQYLINTDKNYHNQFNGTCVSINYYAKDKHE